MMVTFSGLDGSGKTTLIGALKCALAAKGVAHAGLTMYDDVGLYAWARSLCCVGRRAVRYFPQRRVRPADLLAVTSPSLAMRCIRGRAMKRIVFLIDVIVLLLYRAIVECACRRVLILDRYFYDAIAELAGGRLNLCSRFLLRVVPEPTLAFFIDVSPETAFARKHEYSVHVLTLRREVYFQLFPLVQTSWTIPNTHLETASKAVVSKVMSSLPSR